MLFIYKITAVKLCMSLRKDHEVTLAANDAAAYTPCLQTHRKLFDSYMYPTNTGHMCEALAEG